MTEDYVNKHKGGKGCSVIFVIASSLILTIVCGFLFGAIYGLIIGGVVFLGLIGQLTDDKEKNVAKNKIIEKSTQLETNIKRRAVEGNIIPEKFANVKAIRKAKKLVSENPNISFQELFSLLDEKKEAYKKTLSPQQRKIVAELPYFIDSYYIFNYGRSDKL